jgi:hypothetical protein
MIKKEKESFSVYLKVKCMGSNFYENKNSKVYILVINIISINYDSSIQYS